MKADSAGIDKPCDSGLIAHWPLAGADVQGDCCVDRSGNGNDGVAHGIDFTSRIDACFDGRTSHVEIPCRQGGLLDLGTADFTLAAWAWTGRDLDDVLGDILAKYDPATRKGFNLCLMNFHGVTSTQPNHRNVFFGLDDGAESVAWRDCGRLGNALLVWALCVHEGHLYAGTFETGKDQAGHVYRYEGGARWTDCGVPFPCNAVSSLAVHDGRLYAGVSHYRSAGSALSESENLIPGGRVFRHDGGDKWTDCGKVGEGEAIGGMTAYRGRLYASSMYAPAGLYRYEGGAEWSCCGNPGGRIESLTVHDGHLYGSGWDLGYSGVYRYDGAEDWTDCGTPAGTTQTYSFAQHCGRLYVGTWPSGKVFRYGGGNTWEDCGQLGGEQEVMPMLVFNGKLYAGTLPLAAVYRYDGDGHWPQVGQLDLTPDVKYRRVWSMAVFQGKLFCGVLPSGHVHAFEAGQCVTYDSALKDGWRHIAAVRHQDVLRLYVDGKQVALSLSPAKTLDIANDSPLTIGFGAHDYFNGRLRDVRVYRRSLWDEEVANLHRTTRL